MSEFEIIRLLTEFGWPTPGPSLGMGPIGDEETMHYSHKFKIRNGLQECDICLKGRYQLGDSVKQYIKCLRFPCTKNEMRLFVSGIYVSFPYFKIKCS